MECQVFVDRHRRTGAFVMNPAATFKGYGAYVGVEPYRELTSGASDAAIGEAVVGLLERSGPTGVHIRDVDAYGQSVTDVESERVRQTYRSNIRSTRDIHRRFLHCAVSRRDRQNSWKLTRFKYDSERGSLVLDQERRVPVSTGPETLGRVLRELLEVDEQ